MTYLKPVLPVMAEKSEAFLGLSLDWTELNAPLEGHTINNFSPLIQRIDPDAVAAMVEARKTYDNLYPLSDCLDIPYYRERMNETGKKACRSNMLGDFAVLLIAAVLVNNFVLVQFLGLCPFMGVSNKLDTAIGMSAATTFVLTLASVCSFLTYRYLLEPLDLTYLRTLSFILVIAVVVQFTEMVVRKTSPLLHRVLGVYLPLITTNCAVLGVALLNINQAHNFMESLIYGLGAALGFSLVLVLFAAMRERLVVADVPEPFQGAAIGMITAGLASLAFMGFAGLV